MSLADKLQTIAVNTQKVYDAGFGLGLKSEYDRFWDTYQQNGNRREVAYSFSGSCWDNSIFHPKYDIVCSTGYSGKRYLGMLVILLEIFNNFWTSAG